MVEAASPRITRLSRLASVINTAVAEGSPLESTHLPTQLESVGVVDDTNTAKVVFVGLLFSLFVIVRVEVEGDDRVGALGVLANVYIDELAEAVPVLMVEVEESLACT